MNCTNDRNGFINEYDFINKIHNKRFKDLDFSIQLFLEDLFNITNRELVVRVVKNKELHKGDIFINYNGITKTVSIKKGYRNSVHVESVNEFIEFLRKQKVDDPYIEDYLLYHYADGTINNSGTNRISAADFKLSNQDLIDDLNYVLNTKEIIIAAVNRFLIKGNYNGREIDCLLYGVPEDFLWIKTEDIYTTCLAYKDFISSGVHIGPLFIQCMNRCLGHNPKYESKRNQIQVKWYNLFDDIIFNMGKIY